MTRLLIHVEGQTEEDFVNEVLRDYLVARGFLSVNARLFGNARLRKNRGGVRSWGSTKNDIRRHLSSDTNAYATTMVDFYGMPGSWPGRTEAALRSFVQRGPTVQEAMQEDFSRDMHAGFDDARFIPYVMMHEFEALLFSDCAKFAGAIGMSGIEAELQEIRDSFNSPEEINDSPSTAPSKRIQRVLPGYEKPLHGNIAALEIGIETMKESCPHFSSWIQQLELLA